MSDELVPTVNMLACLQGAIEELHALRAYAVMNRRDLPAVPFIDYALCELIDGRNLLAGRMEEVGHRRPPLEGESFEQWRHGSQ